MNILIGLGPALIWGFLPLALAKFVKGGEYVQMVGTGIGVTLVSLITVLVTGPAVPDSKGLILCFLSGFAWLVGMYGQLTGYWTVGVSRVFPLSTGVQIVGNAILGWLVLHEWSGISQVLAGFLMILVIIVGIILCNKETKKEIKAEKSKQKASIEEIKIMILVGITSLGYCGYSLFPKLSGVKDPMAQTLPQSVGVLTGAVLITMMFGRKNPFKLGGKHIAVASIVGLLYGSASLVYLISIGVNGMVKGFILSQLNMVIATLTGIYIIKEKQKVPLWRTYLGIAAIFAGCIGIQFV